MLPVSASSDNYTPHQSLLPPDIYDLMYNVSVEVEVKDNTLVVSFDKLFADNSTFTYKINICLNKKPEYKYQYVIGYAKLCERWYYSEERKYNME